MARQMQVSAEDIRRAKQLRDKAATVAEYRKPLSVILPNGEIDAMNTIIDLAAPYIDLMFLVYSLYKIINALTRQIMSTTQ